MSANKEPLPVCRLCRQPCRVGEDDTLNETWSCANEECPVHGMDCFTERAWRALMSPQVVTDAMVERAMSVLPRYTGVGTQEMIGRSQLRAVLEAALKE